ncbi:MAG: AAA family ATPase [Lachnospiraceae bacterium]|nr:AAA family ATPase [Lachnospiraceae bacterium]
MNRYLRAVWERMERAGALDLGLGPADQDAEDQDKMICAVCERFLLAGAQLPEGEVLGWQLAFKKNKNHLFSSSTAVSREDINWIFRPLGYVSIFRRGRSGQAETQNKDRRLYILSSASGSMRDSVRFRRYYRYDGYYSDDEDQVFPDEAAVSELFEMLSESDAMIRLMAGPVSEKDPGNGMILISLRGEMPVRMKTLLSQVFLHLTAVDPSAVDPEDQNSLCLSNQLFLNAMTVFLRTAVQPAEGKKAGNRKRLFTDKANETEKGGMDGPKVLPESDNPGYFEEYLFPEDPLILEDPDDPLTLEDPEDPLIPEDPEDPPEGNASGRNGGSGKNLLPNPDYAGDETRIDDLVLSVRSYNCLRRAGIGTVGDLAKHTEEDLKHIRNLGKKGFQEVLETFRNYINDPGHIPCPERISESKLSEERKSYLDSLDELTGLTEVKKQLKKIAALARLKKDMKELGKEAGPFSLNMEFIGNPGTAKTTVARIATGLFYEAGLLTSDTFVEVGRADLIARYEGQTADDVRRIFDRADGKVLFIDEAYSLLESHEGEFGDEAINTIVQEMENRRDRTIVIFAGYPDKMEAFFQRNPGLRSRVPFTLRFEDYSEEELARIAETEADRRGFKISEEASAALHEACLYASSRPEMGNGRFARNLIENAILSYAARVYQQADLTPEEDRREFTLISSDFVFQYKKTEAERCPLGFHSEKKAG